MAPKGHSTRPTADRTRQALFNVLEHAAWSPGLQGIRVVDLFAGAGGLGLEALSRGAAFCRFIDNDRLAVETLRGNVSTLSVAERSEIVLADATRLASRSPAQGLKFDVAFLDAPYSRDLSGPALEALAQGDWLVPQALVVVERGAGEGALTSPGFSPLDGRKWGVAQVDFLQYRG